MNGVSRARLLFIFLCSQQLTSSMASTDKEVANGLPPFVLVCKDGSVERPTDTPYVPPSPLDQETQVSSKDITISDNPPISARLYLPKMSDQTDKKLPILVYFHGGGFSFESAFSSLHHRYLLNLVSESQVLGVSVEYRLAPEHLLPVGYDDCWAALDWVASHSAISNGVDQKEAWLLDHGDFDRLFIGGDSAGGNIAHNILMRAGVEVLNGGVKIFGALLCYPYFWSSEPVLSEPKSAEEREKSLLTKIWNFVHPSAPDGIDNPMINPIINGVQSLEALGCSHILVTMAEKDELRDRNIWYYNAVKESGWKGEVEMVDVKGEDHCFQMFKAETESAKAFFKRVANFLNK